MLEAKTANMLSNYQRRLSKIRQTVGNFARLSNNVPKDSRHARRAQFQQRNQGSAAQLTVRKTAVAIGLGLLTYSYVEISSGREGWLRNLYISSGFDRVVGATNELYCKSFLKPIVDTIHKNTFKKFSEVFEPSSDKLIPDWPTAPCYGNPPPGTPAPPLLVLDLEKTLIGSVYDTRFGWRHVKRPGLEKFLNSLAQYYEIVIFSENDIGIAQEVLMAIDPEGKCHKLGASAAEAKNGKLLKRLDYMNRDLSRILLIDDNPESFALFPENTIQIRPFDNINDKSDTILLDLLPLLQAMVHDNATDFRKTLQDLGTNDAEEAVIEYKMRLHEKKVQENMKRNKGLGGVIRKRLTTKTEDIDTDRERSSILSPSEIVGQAKASEITSVNKPQKKQGALFQWLESTEKEKEEYEMKKREKMNEIYVKRISGQQN